MSEPEVIHKELIKQIKTDPLALYNDFIKKQRDFSVSKNGNEKIPKILQILLKYLLR